MFDQEALSDFLLEAWELMDTLDQDLVSAEDSGFGESQVQSTFRVMHTLKGCAGFLNLVQLERVAHCAESLLDSIREGRQAVTPTSLQLLFETADAVRALLKCLEREGREGDLPHPDLPERLRQAGHPDQPAKSVPPLESRDDPASRPLATAPLSAATDPALHPIVQPAVGPRLETSQNSAGPAESSGSAAGAVGDKQELGEIGRGESEECPRDLRAPDTPLEDTVLEELDDIGSLSVTEGSVRVKVDLLDKLMNLVGELVLCRNQLLQLSTRLDSESLTSGSQRLNLVTSELQEHITRTRMQPIGTILNRFPRMVRELARQSRKEIRFSVEGQDTGLDRTILEAIKDPLLHIVRNAIDHGLETPEERVAQGKPARGSLMVRAHHEGGQVIVEISDDGRGLDPTRLRERAVHRGLLTHHEAERLTDREALRLIFQAGFSTADAVTNISGRGVGMDVVRAGVERIGGTVDLASKVGRGLTITLRIPLTLAIIPALVVSVAGQKYAIPQVNLQELVHLNEDQLDTVHGTEVYRLRGSLMPLLRLRQVLYAPETEDNQIIVVVQADGRSFGLVVDADCDTEEIVVKPLTRDLKQLQLYAGATIMGDGRVGLILDVGGLGRICGLSFEDQRNRDMQSSAEADRTRQEQSMLLFRLQDSELFAIPLGLVSRLEEFENCRVESAAGRRLVQYRGRLLPLTDLSEVLGRGGIASDPLRVIVFSNDSRDLGVVVGEILDVIKGQVEMDNDLRDSTGILMSAIINGQAVTVVDVLQLLRQTTPEWLRPAGERVSHRRSERGQVLVANSSEFLRTLTRTYLETEGYTVHEVADAERALAALEDGYDRVVVDLSMEGAAELLVRLSNQGQSVVGIEPPGGDSIKIEGMRLIPELDRDHLIRALEGARLAQEV